MPAEARAYDELRLRLEPRQEEGYRVLASAGCGEASGSFELPFAALEIENFVLRASRGREARRRMESPQTVQAREFGGRLFDALFRQRVRDVYHEALADADRTGHGLRITLALTDTPELMDLPWEFLYDEPNFLAISVMTPVVRYLDLPRTRRPLQIVPPLRILGMVSSPSDAAQLDTAREQANLERALGALIDAGHVDLRWLRKPTLSALLHELRTEPPNVFHYIGHGMYDHAVDDGVVLLEDDAGRARAVSGTELGTILQGYQELRLAVLNACEGARTARDDPFAGVAASLVQRDIPAVIAMQFEITDQAAIVFAEGFYEAIAVGFPVDAALAEARKSIFADHHDIEWGTPVLFMRVPDGRIFDIPRDIEPPRPTRLEVSLSVTPAVAQVGEQATWRLDIENVGRSPLSSLTVLDGDGRQICGPMELAAGGAYQTRWTAIATADTDQTVTVGGQTAGGALVSGQASAHLAVREGLSRVEPRPEPPPTDEHRRTPAIAAHWHVNAGVVVGEGLAVLGGAALVLVTRNHTLHHNLRLSFLPEARGWTVIAIIACAIVLRLLVWSARRGSPFGVIASLAAAGVALVLGLDELRKILDDPGFAEHGSGALVALGGAITISIGAFIAVLGGIAATMEGLRSRRR
jgi:CHAT domain